MLFQTVCNTRSQDVHPNAFTRSFVIELTLTSRQPMKNHEYRHFR